MAIDFAARQRWMIAVLAANLAPNVKNVGVRISLFINAETGRCFPAKETLARATGLAKRTVDRAVDVLVAAGWLAVEASGGRKANNYGLRFPNAVAPLNPVTQTSVGDANPVTQTTPTLSPRPPQQRTEHKTSFFSGSETAQRKEGPSGLVPVASSDKDWPRIVATERLRRGKPNWHPPIHVIQVAGRAEEGWAFPIESVRPPLHVVGGREPP